MSDKYDLVYLEFITTNISDLSALSNLSSLTELNINNSPVSDFTPLYSLTSLRRFVPDYRLSTEELQAIKENLPDCTIAGLDTYEGNLWNTSEIRAVIKECFKCWDYVDYFNSVDDYKI